jgi:hypothetical protein
MEGENHNRVWWAYFKDRARKLLSRLWSTLAIYSVFILFASTAFVIWALWYSDMQTLPFEVSGLVTVVLSAGALGASIPVFTLSFILLFIFSLSTRGRRTFDKLFRFPEYTEIEKLRKEMQNELTPIKEKLDNIEATFTIIKSRLRKKRSSNKLLKRKSTKVVMLKNNLLLIP